MKQALPSLASKVAFLSHPGSYATPVHRVDRIETHMSWVFLAGKFAYKLKKPVNNEFVDLRSVAARQHYCMEELRLNRRLAKDIYIGVVPLVLAPSGLLQLGGDARLVDCLIKMHRIPAWLMLDVAIAHQSATVQDAQRIARGLAAFHQALPPERMAPPAYRRRFACAIAAMRVQLREAPYGLAPGRIDTLCDRQCTALGLLGPLLEARCKAGNVVEGHGDLRPEHVCLLPEVAVIDCLEFSRDLRVLDKADEAGYLALECERLGAPALAQALGQAYQACAGDYPPPPLVHFYQSCRASMRALLAARHLREEKFRYSPHWRHLASAYLDLALAHVRAAHGN